MTKSLCTFLIGDIEIPVEKAIIEDNIAYLYSNDQQVGFLPAKVWEDFCAQHFLHNLTDAITLMWGWRRE